MSERYHRGFSAAEKTELWDRWQRGESLKAIGRAFGKPSSSIYFQLAPHGGIRPAPRRRSRLALTLSEREEISRGIAAHRSARLMARLLGHSRSTVSREISRNGGYDRYRAALADEQAWVRARRPKRCKLAKPATTTGSGEKAQIELVARADSRLAEESASRGWVLSRVT
jgi:IS30 family transposase